MWTKTNSSFRVEQPVEKYSLFLNFSDNPELRIYRQPPVPLYKVGLKWTTCLEQKTQLSNGGEGGTSEWL